MYVHARNGSDSYILCITVYLWSDYVVQYVETKVVCTVHVYSYRMVCIPLSLSLSPYLGGRMVCVCGRCTLWVSTYMDMCMGTG